MEFIPQVISLTDYFRLPLSIEAEAEKHKEWHHFCLISPGVEAIINLNLMRTQQDSGWQARLIALVKTAASAWDDGPIHSSTEQSRGIWDGGPIHSGNGQSRGVWDGDVDTIPSRDVVARRGKIDLTFGQNSLQFRDGCFYLSLALENRPITMQLVLEPACYPLIRRNTRISGGKISWVVVPRLRASGTIIHGARLYRLQDAPAYHDHNWGAWSWGEDFSWQWGYAVPASAGNPWCIVFDRLTDRKRSSALELKVSLWKGQRLHRLYMQDEIETHQRGFVTQTRDGASPAAKFPRPMGLLAPELATDVPRLFEVTARRGSDHLECRYEADDVAQIILPNDTDLGVTIINEVSGAMRLSGVVAGEKVAMEGRGFFEFLT